jgi:hypothetical protein
MTLKYQIKNGTHKFQFFKQNIYVIFNFQTPQVTKMNL